MSQVRLARSAQHATAHLKLTRRPELVREFIHDCLYNEREGYFQRHVNIFTSSSPHSSPRPIYSEMRDQEEYTRRLYDMYRERTLSLKFYQLWHTPSELFRPFYARGVTEFIEGRARETLCRDEPIVIYEAGPGNGSLCADIIETFQSKYPSRMPTLEYHLVEVSQKLAREHLSPLQKKFPRNVFLHNRSFLDWAATEPRASFVLAMEMFDNLPQDRVRFNDQGDLEQAMVFTNDEARYGDAQRRYTEAFVPVADHRIAELVAALDAVDHRWPSLRRSVSATLSAIWPFSVFDFASPWTSEFIPTGPYSFLKTLCRRFPRHTLLMTDFDALPDTIPGHGAPVVQTRYEGETVACSTYLLQRGLFDVFFPLDFPTLSLLYHHLTGRRAVTCKHRHFCQQYADPTQTATRSGYNPMLHDFSNVSFLLTDPCGTL